MSILLIKALGALSLIVITILFGILPLKIRSFRQNWLLLSLSNCFSGGLFIAIGLIHILPEAHELLEGSHDHDHDHDFDYSNLLSSKQSLGHLKHGSHAFPLSYFISLISFSVILLIDKIIFNNSDLAEDEQMDLR